MVRNRFSNYLKRDFFNQLIDVFKEEYAEEHERPISMTSDDIEAFKDSVITFHANERYFDALAKRKNPNMEKIREEVMEEMVKSPYVFLKIPEDFYENAVFYMKLNIDDDIGPDIQTLTTIYTTMEQKQDPRAEQVLRLIMAKQGNSLTYITGKKPAPVAPVNPANPAAPTNPNASVPSNVNPAATPAVPA
jgi:DNA-binding ferritin-like protein (Dps family)